METIEALWCRKCQAGPGDYNKQGVYKSGDKCPRCLAKGKLEDEVGELVGVADYESELKKRAEFIRSEAKKRAPKGQKSVEDHVRESEERIERMVEERLTKILLEREKRGPGRPRAQGLEGGDA